MVCQIKMGTLSALARWAMPISLSSVAIAAGTFTQLGDLPGGVFYSVAGGISADGSVVVGSSDSTAGFEAFRWTSGGGMVDLGSLNASGFSAAYAVSGDGATVTGESDLQGMRWTSGSGMVTLGTSTVYGLGASSDGAVIVGLFTNGSFQSEAFRWTSGSGVVGIGDLPGGAFNSIANACSDDGSVIVGAGVSANGTEAFRWVSGVMTGLGDLPTGSFSSTAYACSGDGSIVVGTGKVQTPSGSNDEGFRWTQGTGMQPLGFLTTGSISIAQAISPDGSLILGAALDGTRLVGAIWDGTTTGPQRLQHYLALRGVPIPAGFSVGRPTGATIVGGTVHMCGSGVNALGNPEAWVATYPNLPLCPGDLNADRITNEADLGILLGAWQTSDAGDLDNDGQTSEPDLGIVLGSWQVSCP
ncbi:MAG: PEP-CTERM sorting domain-containing protein [Phycisphaerae bacterium]